MQSEQSEQPVWGVPTGPLPIFDCPNRDPPVPLPPPVHGHVMNWWKAMQHPIKLLKWQEAIVQLAEASHHQHDVDGISGESVPVTSWWFCILCD